MCVPVTTSERLKKKRKIGESGEGEEDADKKKKKKKESQRPNYFVSIPITNPQVPVQFTQNVPYPTIVSED